MKSVERQRSVTGVSGMEAERDSSVALVEEIERDLEMVRKRLDKDYDADIQAIAQEIHEIISVLLDTQVKLLKLMTHEDRPV